VVEVEVTAGAAVAASSAVAVPDEEPGVDADRNRVIARNRFEPWLPFRRTGSETDRSFQTSK
jgi:hypothetical protein